ncbi:MAG: phosphotransferase family protein [Eubacterium sp.]
MNNKSKLSEMLTNEQIGCIFYKHFLIHIQSVRQLHGGMFNTTYLVRSKNEQYILRVGPVHTDLLLPFEQHLGEAEVYVCNLLQENNIPANQPLISDFSKQIINRDYMIFSYIDGINMSEKEVKKSNKPHLQKQVGAVTKRIHQITGDYFGRVSDSFKGVTFSKWCDYLFYELQTLIKSCKKHNVFSEKILIDIESLFKQGKPYLNYISSPKLVHMDLWEGNIMIDKNQKQILAVIDTDRCLFGDPDMDLANPWLITEDFLEGYGELPHSEYRKIKILYYQLLYSIIDAYVWKVEYCNKLNYRKSFRQVKSLIKQIKSLFN